MTVFGNEPTLTPIASVDTSSTDSGVSMFTLFLDASFGTAGNLFQFEDYIYSPSDELVPVTNSFIALEDAVSPNGIYNQYNIAVPSLSNIYTPVGDLLVKIRGYIATDTDISVSPWSNTVPVHNPPQGPQDPVAFMVYSSASDELLYVQIKNNTTYDLDVVKFIVSYSFMGLDMMNQWIVSEPLDGTVSNDATHITLPPISFESFDQNVYVAVNAVFSYEYLGDNYYTVSQISPTVKATAITPEPAILNPILIPQDYLVYSTPSEQKVELSWIAPTSGNVPGYEIVSYQLFVSANGTILQTITGLPTVAPLTYVYTIPAEYYAAGTPSSTFSFLIQTINANDDVSYSNSEAVNTFTYADKPRNVIVAWANGATNSVDMLVTFKNPSNVGQGTVQDIQLEVIGSDGITTSTRTITYVAGVNYTYSEQLYDLATTQTGSVKVYMQTKDTNITTGTTSYAIQDGAADTSNYVVSELPVITNVVYDDDGLTFKVFSETPLVNINELISYAEESPYLFATSFFSNAEQSPYSDGQTPVGSYTVTLDTTNDNLYTFTFSQQWLINAGINSNLIIVVSNNFGISHEAVPYPVA